jgi:hypothetical protein
MCSELPRRVEVPSSRDAADAWQDVTPGRRSMERNMTRVDEALAVAARITYSQDS